MNHKWHKKLCAECYVNQKRKKSGSLKESNRMEIDRIRNEMDKGIFLSYRENDDTKVLLKRPRIFV
jgi:hypothetical protein